MPRSYCVLQNFVEEEARRLKEVGQPPVLNQKEFATLAEKTEDITDPEELTLGESIVYCYRELIIAMALRGKW